MKKICLSILAIAVITSLAEAATVTDDEFNTLANTTRDYFYKAALPFYKNLYSCTPYSIKYDIADDEIYGLENGKCHFRQGNQHCYYPTEVYKKVAADNINSIKTMLNKLNNGIFEIEGGSPSSLESNYCKLEY